jgi:hypothetical protein
VREIYKSTRITQVPDRESNLGRVNQRAGVWSVHSRCSMCLVLFTWSSLLAHPPCLFSRSGDISSARRGTCSGLKHILESLLIFAVWGKI